jgi:hypothetical protein
LILIAALGGWSLQSRPAASDPNPDPKAVQITNGPVVENVTETTAVIAWSTNVSAGTVLHYGTDPYHLTLEASMPWGGLTHRVNLKDLTPGTTYYFQAESPMAQGTGTTVESPPSSFRTKSRGGCVTACT